MQHLIASGLLFEITRVQISLLEECRKRGYYKYDKDEIRFSKSLSLS
jgi:hypothetical protein